MPRFDGTGPNGCGAKTGLQMGNCDGSNEMVSFRRGCRGRGRNRGRGFNRFADTPNIEQRIKHLEDRLSQLKGLSNTKED